MTKKPTPSRLNEAMLETAEGMHRLGIMDDATYEKITLRHFGAQPTPAADPSPATKSARFANRRIRAKPSSPDT